jgi:hypothetical protein
MPIQIGQERKALRSSISHLFERSSVLREHEILAEALNQSLGSLDLGRLKHAASNGEGGLVRLTDSPGIHLLSECYTRRGLQLEQRAVKYVNGTKNSCPALNSTFVPAAHLSQEQNEAVTSILSTRDRVFSFRGVAGSGKTTTLREVQRGLSEAGHRVFAVTPTTSAARMLRGCFRSSRIFFAAESREISWVANRQAGTLLRFNIIFSRRARQNGSFGRYPGEVAKDLNARAGMRASCLREILGVVDVTQTVPSPECLLRRGRAQAQKLWIRRTNPGKCDLLK